MIHELYTCALCGSIYHYYSPHLRGTVVYYIRAHCGFIGYSSFPANPSCDTALNLRVAGDATKAISDLWAISSENIKLTVWLSFNLVYRCSLPLGLENGHVSDAAFSASSSLQAKYAPARARLNLQGSSKGFGAWCAKTNNGKQWLQIDFGELVQVTKVATQGQQNGNHWVTKFTLSYSMDGIHWAEYKENSVTWVSDNHQLLHSWTKLMRQFHLIFF